MFPDWTMGPEMVKKFFSRKVFILKYIIFCTLYVKLNDGNLKGNFLVDKDYVLKL